MANNKIRELRKAAGLTQEQLSARLNVKRATLARYEAGTIDPPTSQLQAIASALGVSVGRLLGQETERIIIPVQELIADWSAVDKEEFKRVFIHGEGLEPPARIAVALERLNATGAGKVADYAEDLTHVPRYTAPEPPQGTLAPPEGTDTTPPPDGPQRPPEGQE